MLTIKSKLTHVTAIKVSAIFSRFRHLTLGNFVMTCGHWISARSLKEYYAFLSVQISKDLVGLDSVPCSYNMDDVEVM